MSGSLRQQSRFVGICVRCVETLDIRHGSGLEGCWVVGARRTGRVTRCQLPTAAVSLWALGCGVRRGVAGF